MIFIYESLHNKHFFKDFFKFLVIFSVKALPPACSHANSNMSRQRNFRNPTHGSEVVNATRFGPASPRACWAKELSQKFHQIALRKVKKIVKKKYFGKYWYFEYQNWYFKYQLLLQIPIVT
jgi:hypothetical protein